MRSYYHHLRVRQLDDELVSCANVAILINESVEIIFPT